MPQLVFDRELPGRTHEFSDHASEPAMMHAPEVAEKSATLHVISREVEM